MRTARVPRLAVAAWMVAAGVLAVLVVAVVGHLDAAGGHAGMSHGAAALIRGGTEAAHADTAVRPAPGRPSWQLDAIARGRAGPDRGRGLPDRGGAGAGRAGHALAGAAHGCCSSPGLRCALFATNGSIAVYDQALFTAHMAGHLALVMLAPVLLVAGRPLTLALAAAPPAGRARLERVLQGRVVSVLTAPPVALACYTAVIVGSHLTGLMDTIMRNTWAGQLEHLVYVLVGCQFFVLVVGHEPIRWQLSAPARWRCWPSRWPSTRSPGIVLMQGAHAWLLAPSGSRSMRCPTPTPAGRSCGSAATRSWRS